MLILTRRDVEELLDPDELIEGLFPAMVDLSAHAASIPPRQFARAPLGMLGVMPAFAPSHAVLESKLVTVFPNNTSLPTHQALICMFDPSTGAPVALMDGTYITAMRTAAGSALATRVLARGNASVLTILGTGVQARSHLRLVPRVRNFLEIRIAGRDIRVAESVAEEFGAVPYDSFAEASEGADVVCACTSSTEPVVRRANLAPGAHVTSVGWTKGREVDAETVTDALVAVESREAAIGDYPNGANDLAWAIRDGQLDAANIVEIGELLSGARQGRTEPTEITLYKSVGVAVQDATAAALVVSTALERRVGIDVALD